MATRFEIAIQQGAVDVTNLRNEIRFRTSPGFRVIAKPRGISAFGSQDALNRAVARAKRTGVFPASQFIGIFRVSNIGAFTPGVPTGVGGRPLTKASIRGLVKAGVLQPRFETRAGIAVKKVETPSQRSFRLARERRISRTFGRFVPSVGKLRAQELERARQFFREKGGPFAIGVTKEQLGSSFLEEFNVLFTRKTLKLVVTPMGSRTIEVCFTSRKAPPGTSTG